MKLYAGSLLLFLTASLSSAGEPDTLGYCYNDDFLAYTLCENGALKVVIHFYDDKGGTLDAQKIEISKASEDHFVYEKMACEPTEIHIRMQVGHRYHGEVTRFHNLYTVDIRNRSKPKTEVTGSAPWSGSKEEREETKEAISAHHYHAKNDGFFVRQNEIIDLNSGRPNRSYVYQLLRTRIDSTKNDEHRIASKTVLKSFDRKAPENSRTATIDASEVSESVYGGD